MTTPTSKSTSRITSGLSVDEELNLIDYKKIGYEKCDLEDQTDTCEISFCETIVTYKVQENNYAVVHKKEREFDCDTGKRKEVETDSTLLRTKDRKFMFRKLQ